MSVWGTLLEQGKRILSLARDTQKNTEEIKELREEVRRLSDAVKLLVFEAQRTRDEVHHIRELESGEREKLALRLENQLLRKGIAPPEETKE